MIDLEKRIEDAIKLYCDNKDSMHVPPKDTDIDVVLSDCLNKITELKQKLEKLESGEFVALPIIPNDAISIALSYQCFDFIGVAKIYRDLGFDIPKKAEKEQAFFLHKFLILAIKHGNDFIKVFNSETKAMIEALEKDHE